MRCDVRRRADFSQELRVYVIYPLLYKLVIWQVRSIIQHLAHRFPEICIVQFSKLLLKWIRMAQLSQFDAKNIGLHEELV